MHSPTTANRAGAPRPRLAIVNVDAEITVSFSGASTGEALPFQPSSAEVEEEEITAPIPIDVRARAATRFLLDEEDTATPAGALPTAPVLPFQPSNSEGALVSTSYPLERCAVIAASIARSRHAALEILDAHALDAATWAALESRWSAAIRAEECRGRGSLLARHDAAYVAQLERERGPIGVEEYARLAVALERGTMAAELAALSLPSGAMVRIQRVWIGRIAADATLGKMVLAAIEAAREA